MARKKDDFAGIDDPNILHEEIIMPSTIENIDSSLFEFVNDKLDIFCTTNKGFEKVPVVWVSAERAYQIKNDKGLRDKNGSFILPVITVERGAMEKSLTRKGGVFGGATDPNASVVIARRIKQDKTRKYINKEKHEKNP